MMKILPSNTTHAINRELLADISKVWKVGQILNATTEQGGDASSKVLLRVGQYTLETKTPVPLQNGQKLKLQVNMPLDNKTGNLPVLKILTPATLNSAVVMVNSRQAVESQTIAAVKLRQFIAVQQSFSQLQQLSQTLLTNKTSVEQLPQSLKLWLNKIQHNLQVNNKNISATQLKQHILNSGIFLESKLHKQVSHPATAQKTQTLLSNDLKYQLLAVKSELNQFNNVIAVDKSPQPLTPQQLKQLQTQIQQTGNNPAELVNKLLTVLPESSLKQLTSLLASPQAQISIADELKILAQILTQITQQQGQLAQKSQSLFEQLKFRLMLLDLGHQIEQSIHKLSSMQLQPLSRESDNLMLLLFNLVFKDNHQQFDVNFRIQQQDENSETDKESWQVTLGFNFKTLGNVQSKIFLTNNQISTVFYTELSATGDKIQQLLPLLKTGLENAGLQVKNLAVSEAPFEEESVLNRDINLLDEIA